ncbi:CCR4-NOT transcription complex subunit 1 [Trichinella nativa]|uniref:CCR4-NOT transcription complex subunit 1 n=1 Tax=Trichinella nativa TaxID=6335 RepID=A0A0V1LJT1_9BILA|nr:CCR4-NOT transcription complex subunit 1 [Trichinella nativa]
MRRSDAARNVQKYQNSASNRQDYLDLKSLLVEAFWKGQQELIYVVPFTAKVFESCANNKIFHANCRPWTLNILGVLREIHEQEGLKLNLKFEIEVLYRHLKIELEAIKVGTVLRCPHMIQIIMCMTEPQLGGSSEFDPRCVTVLEGTMYLDSPLAFGLEMETQEVIVPPREPPPPPPPLLTKTGNYELILLSIKMSRIKVENELDFLMKPKNGT